MCWSAVGCRVCQCNKTCAIQLIFRRFLVTYHSRQITLPLDRRPCAATSSCHALSGTTTSCNNDPLECLDRQRPRTTASCNDIAMDGGWMDVVTMNGWLQIHWFNVLEVLSEFGTYYYIKLGSLFSNSSINYFPDFFLFSVFSP